MRNLRPYLCCVGVFGLLLHVACARHAVDQHPAPLFDMPSSYSVSSEEAGSPDTPWWEALGDPALDGVIRDALARNFTLAQGLTRIEQSQAFLRQSRALRKPQLGLTTDVDRTWERQLEIERPSTSTSSSSGTSDPATTTKQASSNGSSSGGSSSSGGVDRNSWETQYSAGAGLRWEVDLWGRLHSLVQADRAELEALTADYASLRLLLSAEVAEAYYGALEQHLQHALLLEQRALGKTFLDLLELRFLQGDASAVDILQQRDQVTAIDAEIPLSLSQERLFENRIDVLLGMPPDGEDRAGVASRTFPSGSTIAPLEVPAALLQHRPDLKALERIAVAADYRVAAAMAERLPGITLDGSLSVRDTTGGLARMTATGAVGLFQPLLDWGLREAAVDASRAAVREALLAYSQAYLLAIEEVETALWQEARQRERIELLRERENLLQSTVEETRVRYSLGVTDYLPVLTALQDLQSVQRALLREQRGLVSLRIRIFRALGSPTHTPDSSPEQSATTGKDFPRHAEHDS